MATVPKTTTDKPAEAAETILWEGLNVTPLQGANYTPKEDLEGKPFAITGIKATFTKESEDRPSVPGVVVEADLGRNPDGTRNKKYFTDYSTGIKVTCEELLTKHHNWQGEQDKWYDFPGFLCPEGVQKSTYEKTVKGKKTTGVTYYLTMATNNRP